MSTKAFNVKASFSFRVVADDQVQEDMLKAIEATPTRSVKGHEGLVRAYAEGGMDAAIAYTVRNMMKDLRKYIVDEADKANFKNFSPFTVEVTPRGN